MSFDFDRLGEYAPNYWKDTLREAFVSIVEKFDLKNISIEKDSEDVFFEEDPEEVFLERLDQELASFLEDSDIFSDIDCAIVEAYDLGHDNGYELASEEMYTQDYIDEYYYSNEDVNNNFISREEHDEQVTDLEKEIEKRNEELAELAKEVDYLRALTQSYKSQFSFLEKDLQTFKQKVKADYIAELEAEEN